MDCREPDSPSGVRCAVATEEEKMWLALAALTLAAAIGFNVLALAIQDPKR
jgi:hypothetical protein